MPTEITVILIMLLAVTVQSLAGFGAALVGMPLLTQAAGYSTAKPLFALLVLVTEILLIIRHREDFTFRSVWRLMLASVIAIPMGITVGKVLPEALMLQILGVIVLLYAGYALIAPTLPDIHPRWAYGFGLASGLLSGAYNTGGPPYVMYGTAQGWSPGAFKCNLQTLFLISSLAVIVGHTLAGDITGEVLRYFALTLPVMLVGLVFTFWFDRRISPAVFRRGVLVLLIVIGLTLVF